MTTHHTNALTVLRGMYAAEAAYFAEGGPGKASFATLAPFFAPDVVHHQAAALPYGGTWCGHDGTERLFAAMSRAWSVFEFQEKEVFTAPGAVVVRSQVHARARITGREIDFPILQAVTVTDGRISRVEPFYWDTAAIAAACTGHEQDAPGGTG